MRRRGRKAVKKTAGQEQQEKWEEERIPVRRYHPDYREGLREA